MGIGVHAQARTVRIKNLGNSVITGTVNSGTLSKPFTVRGIGRFRLARNQSKSISITFAPTSSAPFSGTIEITPDLPVASFFAFPVFDLNVSGAGEPGTLALLTPTPLDFGAVKVHRKQTLRLKIGNTGLGVLHGTIDAKTELHRPFGAANAGRFTLPDNGSRLVTVTFAPTSTGPFSGTITITSDDPTQEPVPVTVHGIGE